ncbi:MAG: SHD1 domain-containing protein [Rubripirellula sp.]
MIQFGLPPCVVPLVVPLFVMLLASCPVCAADDIDPVRVGDQVEVLSFSSWYPGVVESFAAGKAVVKYKSSFGDRSSEFDIAKMRFPNNEGHWTVWKDATGKFRVEARYISRTKTDVTIRKADGTDATVPIAGLHPTIRAQLAKTPVTADLVAPVRAGDQVEVQSWNKWYPGTVKSFSDEKATVEYDAGRSSPSTGTFKLEDVRFANGEGHWRIWKDASAKFQIEARFISRTETDVTIRKTDDSEITIPIASLHGSLRTLLAKTPITSELNKIDGAIPIRVNDQIQARVSSTWYDGVVKEVRVVGALIEYDKGSWGKKTELFELDDLRYPNGEGHWRQWDSASGDSQIMGRFMARDETHVTILREDKTEIRVAIEQLSTPLRKLLRETPVIARRPPLVELAGAGLISETPSRTSPRMSLPGANRGGGSGLDLSDLRITLGERVSQQTVALAQGGTAFSIEPKHTIGSVIPVGGSEGWIAVGTHDSSWTSREAKILSQLHWASLTQKKSAAGPKFYPDQRFVTYSPQQRRAVVTSVRGTWSEPHQLSFYRIEAGQSTAVPEFTINIPKKKNSFNRDPVRAELIGDHQMLFGYGGMVSLWDLDQRRVIYQVGDLHSSNFQLNVDHQHFAAMSGTNTVGVYETATGQLSGQGSLEGRGDTTACFSHDGKRLVVATRSEIYRWDLIGTNPVQTLPIGGVQVKRDTQLADLGGGWLVAGPQLYSSGLGLIAWAYDSARNASFGRPDLRKYIDDVSIHHQQMLGTRMLVAATMGGSKGKSALVGVASVPHRDAVEMMKQVDPESIRMLVRGSRIKIDPQAPAQIAAGLRRAAQANGWIEDPASEATLTGSAGPGETQTMTYRTIGFGSNSGSGEETHSVTPWIQKASVVYQDQSAWSTAVGGVPYSVHLSGDQQLGSELQKSSNASYALFDNLKVPEEIIYPKYQRGLGVTLLTIKGFVDIAN